MRLNDDLEDANESNQAEDEDLESYMKSLDAQLSAHEHLDSFQRDKHGNVAVDFNLLRNLVESIEAAGGEFGPADGILANLEE